MTKILNNKNVQSVLWVIFLFTVWEYAARTGLINQYLMHPFTSVLLQLASEIISGNLRIQMLNSLRVVFVGFAISFVLVIIITTICSWLPIVEKLFNTLATFMNPLPSVAIMPFVIMWFGIRTTTVYVIIIHGVLWSLLRYMLYDLRSISELQLEFGRNIRLTSFRLFNGIVVFEILPALLAGLYVGWGRAWRALISAEMIFGMIGNVGGIGFYIGRARAYARIKDVYSGIIIISLIGVIVEVVIFEQIEKKYYEKMWYDICIITQ